MWDVEIVDVNVQKSKYPTVLWINMAPENIDNMKIVLEESDVRILLTTPF